MADVGDGLGYPMNMSRLSTRKLDRVKEMLVDKLDYLKDIVANNKRYTAYGVLTSSLTIASYTLTGSPLVTAGTALTSGSLCGLSETFYRSIKEDF
jgi:hypothetical protein